MRVLIIIFGILSMLTTTSCATRVVNQPEKVVVVKRPTKYKVVHIKGKKYYMWNGHYHRKTKRGYVLVKF